jgi:hypothetical protein
MIHQTKNSVVTRMIGSLCISHKIMKFVSRTMCGFFIYKYKHESLHCDFLLSDGYSRVTHIKCNLTGGCEPAMNAAHTATAKEHT